MFEYSRGGVTNRVHVRGVVVEVCGARRVDRDGVEDSGDVGADRDVVEVGGSIEADRGGRVIAAIGDAVMSSS